MTERYIPPLPFVSWDAVADAHIHDSEVRVGTMVKAYLACAKQIDQPDNEDWRDKVWADKAYDLAWFECCAFLRLAMWDINGWPMDQLGHDFWLTRCGHGTGLWDRDFGVESSRDKLTALAHTFREAYVTVGDDNKLYLE